MPRAKKFFTHQRVEEMEAYVRADNLPGIFYVFVYEGDRKRAHFFGPKGDVVTIRNKSKKIRKALQRAYKIEKGFELDRIIIIKIHPSTPETAISARTEKKGEKQNGYSLESKHKRCKPSNG
jgi:hypothetical protein